MSRWARLSSALVLLACSAARSTTPEAARGEIRYHVALDEALREVTVTVCGALPERLVPIHDEGRARFAFAETAGGSPLAGPVVEVPRGTECVRYRVELVSGGGSPDAPMRFPGAVYAPTSAWLWAPSPRDPAARYPIELSLPEGASHSALFLRDPETGGLSFGEPAFRYVTYAAFGRLTRFTVAAPGGCLEVAAIDGSPPEETLRAWMRSTSDAASRALGHLPHASVGVITVPVGLWAGQDPIAFGMAAHGEHPTLLAYVYRDAPESALVHDWVAVHELSHLGHAFLSGRSAWLTEGLATYYETILRARAGWVSPEVALEQLDGGFRRGERGGTGRTLHDESEDRHRTGAYDRVYWAGAAIALSIDVALRAEGSSLDAAIRRAYGTHEDTLTDEELLLAMDGGAPGTATRVAAPWLESSAFPDLGPAYRALGVTRTDAGLAATDEGAALREALLARSPELAPPARCEP